MMKDSSRIFITILYIILFIIYCFIVLMMCTTVNCNANTMLYCCNPSPNTQGTQRSIIASRPRSWF